MLEEFQRAKEEIKKDNATIPIWAAILQKYTPTLIGECEKSIQWSNEMTKDWLVSGMFAGRADAESDADRVLEELADHAITKSHARHISADRCREIGLDVVALEHDDKLQDAVLTVHHACIHTLTRTPATKIIENHEGTAFIQSSQTVVIQR